jgi:hypothetical protein
MFADLSKFEGELDELAARPENQEMVTILRVWLTSSRSLLRDTYSYAERDEKFKTIICLEHANMIRDHNALLLATKQSGWLTSTDLSRFRVPRSVVKTDEP